MCTSAPSNVYLDAAEAGLPAPNWQLLTAEAGRSVVLLAWEPPGLACPDPPPAARALSALGWVGELRGR